MKRKSLYALFLTVLALAASCAKDNVIDNDSDTAVLPGADFVFDDTKLPQLYVSVSEPEWNRMLQLYDEEPHNNTYVKCSDVSIVRSDGTFKCENVGLRLRGQTSRRRPEGAKGQLHKPDKPDWRHVHFGLNTRVFADSGSFAGVRRINLKYAKEDPSYIREHFCLDMLARYGVWTAPKSSWCRLYLKVGKDSPAYYGVYLMMESIDKQYVKRRYEFGEREGWLWKCAWGANLRDTDDWRFHMDDDSPDTFAYDLKDDNPQNFQTAKAQLKDFIKNLNTLKGAEFYNWIQKVCDVDLLLRTYAALVALGHWDDYWNDMNNFYLYFSGTGTQDYRMYMLPFDLDNTLGTSHNCGVQHDSGRHDPYNWGMKECVLMYKILEVSDFRDKYTQYLRDFASVDNPWTGQLQSASRIRQWQNFISPFIRNDTGEDMVIRDAPASWGNHPEYRLLEDGSNNWFKVKAQSIASYCGK